LCKQVQASGRCGIDMLHLSVQCSMTNVVPKMLVCVNVASNRSAAGSKVFSISFTANTFILMAVAC
jgi:hypothetical protein